MSNRVHYILKNVTFNREKFIKNKKWYNGTNTYKNAIKRKFSTSCNNNNNNNNLWVVIPLCVGLYNIIKK